MMLAELLPEETIEEHCMNDADSAVLPIYLSWGLGVESTAILVRWLSEPASRDFELRDLTVVVAQTGDEHASTRRDVEHFVLPLLAQKRVRLVQLARTGLAEAEGYTVLDDSRTPTRLYTEGAYKLSTKLLTMGVVPAFGSVHKCALHFKSFVIDRWLRDELNRTAGDSHLGSSPLRVARRVWGYNRDETGRIDRAEAAMREAAARLPHISLPHISTAKSFDDDAAAAVPGVVVTHRMAFGFNRDEAGRIARSRTYTDGGRCGEYPLEANKWNWGRAECQEFLRAQFGIEWLKSACYMCPFNALKADGLQRLRAYPEEAGFALYIEHVALAINPRSTLYSGKSLREVMERDGNFAAINDLKKRLRQSDYAVYRVRRIYRRKGVAERCVEQLARGGFSAMQVCFNDLLASRPELVARQLNNHDYLYRRERAANTYPAFEDFYTLAPAIVETKAGRERVVADGIRRFEAKWQALNEMAAGDGTGGGEKFGQLSLI